MGADTVKTYLAFIGPYNETGQYPWDLGGIAGVRRFLERVWNMRERVESIKKKEESIGDQEERRKKKEESKQVAMGEGQQTKEELATNHLPPATSILLSQTFKKVGEDIRAFKFNTAISAMMILVNALEKLDVVPTPVYESLIRTLAPFAPHLTEELWASLGHSTSIHLESWPSYDEAILASAQLTIAVQVNGKMRATFTTAPDTPKEDVLAEAKSLPKITAWLEGKVIQKEFVVPGRLVNLVVAERDE